MRLSFAWLMATALCAAPSACRSKSTPAPAASASLAEAPAPASLVAELSVGNPKETWQRLRALGGSMADALPSSLPVLAATSLSLPPSAAGSLDETVPVVGVLLSRKEAAEPDLVVGMHVLSGAELVASLTLGDGAKFRRVELGPRLVRLVSAPGAQEPQGALGVSGNYLLLASSVDALRDAGRFVAEGVPKRARTEPGVNLRAGESVLSGALAKRLRGLWQARRAALAATDRAEREAKGRAPDFADPAVLLAGADSTIESWLSVLDSSKELSLSLTPEADRLRAEVSLLPAADGAASLLSKELVVGSAAPLLQLPASVRAGLLLRGDASPPPAGQGLGSSVAKLFGERLSEAQAARVVKAFDAFAQSRRGVTVLGFLPTPAPALVVRCELADGAAFSDSFAELLSLLELGPVASWLGEAAGKPSVALSKDATGERRAKLRFRRAVGAKVPLPPALNVSWQALDGVGIIVVSADDLLGPSQLVALPRLDSVAWLRKAQPLADQTALQLFADARLFAPGGPDDAPISLAFGKKAERVSMAVDISAAALPAVARLFALEKSP